MCLVLVYGNGKGVVDFYFAVEVDTYRDDTLATEFAGDIGESNCLGFPFELELLGVEYDGDMAGIEEAAFEQVGTLALQREDVPGNEEEFALLAISFSRSLSETREIPSRVF